MKVFAVIVVAGTLGFMGLSMAQEWPVFAAWLGLSAQARPPTVSPAQRSEAEATVRAYLTMLAHLYQSEGDARFVERMPAAEVVSLEILDDLDYLKRNQRAQHLNLQALAIDEVRPAGEDRIEVDTRERWQVEVFVNAPARALEAGSVEVQRVRYRLGKDGAQWQVQSWDYLPLADAQPANSPASSPASAPAPSAAVGAD